jgi:hypothetical protein
MKRYIVTLETGYAGMDAHEALLMPDDHTEEKLQDIIWGMAVDHASGYGVEVEDSDSFDPEDNEYSGENVAGFAELYDPKKHDGLRSGGGSFEEDFEAQMKWFTGP